MIYELTREKKLNIIVYKNSCLIYNTVPFLIRDYKFDTCLL